MYSLVSEQVTPVMTFEILKTSCKTYRSDYNPLAPIVEYTLHFTKIFILKEGIIKNLSYERRVYESADVSSLSCVIIFFYYLISLRKAKLV